VTRVLEEEEEEEARERTLGESRLTPPPPHHIYTDIYVYICIICVCVCVCVRACVRVCITLPSCHGEASASRAPSVLTVKSTRAFAKWFVGGQGCGALSTFATSVYKRQRESESESE
jgi:hypothetical protein